MIPNQKISEVILEFGDPLLQELPEDYDKVELEGMLMLITSVWNAVTMDQRLQVVVVLHLEVCRTSILVI